MDRIEAIKYIREIVGLPTLKKPPYFSHKEILQIALYLTKIHEELKVLKEASIDKSKRKGATI